MTSTFGAARRTNVAAIGASSSRRVRRSWPRPAAAETTLTVVDPAASPIARFIGYIEILDGVDIGVYALM
jgi:hypothetical protein